jgi:putative tryptophan/tyrosine transport system permease protein
MSWLVPLDIGLVMGLILAYPAIALAVAFRLFNFPDLTIEGSLPIGAAVFGSLVLGDVPTPISVLVAISAGGILGGMTGFLHVRFGINKFLSAIIVVAISYSLNLPIMGTSNISLLRAITIFDSTKLLDAALVIPLHIATIALLSIMLGAICSVLFFALSGRRGIQMRVAGSNPEYARSLGISVPFHLVVALAACNAIAASSGVLLAMYQGFADVSMGQGVLIWALAAVTIGERLVPERHLPYPLYVILSAVVGSTAYQVITSYAVRVGLAPADLRLTTALFVLVVIAIGSSEQGGNLSDSKT